MPNHYEILGVHEAATFNELKRAYYRRAKECHPDKFAGSIEKETEFKLVVRAFDILSEPAKRQLYDQFLGISARGRHNRFIQSSEDSILDSAADDILEELVVGNILLPPGTTLQTLMLDLERTEIFCMFREAKNLYAAGRIQAAHKLLEITVNRSPYNILHRFYLAMTAREQKNWKAAKQQLQTCLELGAARHPPLRLNRIRDELDLIRQRQRSRLWRWLQADGDKRKKINDSSAEDMCRQLGQSLNRENARRQRKRLPAPE